MKTILSLVLLLFLTAACSKDQKASRQLDGTWSLTEVNGAPADDDLNQTLVFEKGKDGEGTGTETYSFGSDSFTSEFVYIVDGDNLIIEDSGDVDTLLIITLNKEELKLNDGDDSFSYSPQ